MPATPMLPFGERTDRANLHLAPSGESSQPREACGPPGQSGGPPRHFSPPPIFVLLGGLGLLVNFPLFGLSIVRGGQVDFRYFVCSAVAALSGSLLLAHQRVPVKIAIDAMVSLLKKPRGPRSK
jgi:hypothetical protein